MLHSGKSLRFMAASLTLAALIFILAGCGGDKEAEQPAAPASAETPAAQPAAPEPPKPAAPPQPVSLNLYLQAAAYITEEDFNKAIAEPIKQKHPHITVNRVVKALPAALTAGETVDMYIAWMAPLTTAKELDFFTDITPMVKQKNIQLDKISPTALGMTYKLSDNGTELYGFPYTTHVSGLYYNKALFDRFGVAYPQDGMTWDQTIELATRLTRVEDGKQFFGLNTDSYMRTTFPLSLALIDTKTDKANINSEPYKRALETFKKIYSSQGQTKTIGSNAAFFTAQNVAMQATINIWASLRTANMDWDVAQYPSYPERPGIFGMDDPHIIVLNKEGKHKEDSLTVMEWMISDTFQQYLVGTIGRFSTMADPKYNLMFGKDIPEFQGKRLGSMLKSKAAPAADFSPYYEKSHSLVGALMPTFLSNEIDVNTLLRQAEEQINQHIASEKK